VNWRLKGLAQKVLGHIPGGGPIHDVLRRRFGGLAEFSRELDSKVEDWSLVMGYLHEVGRSIQRARLLEVGTGWYPTFPWCLYLGGAAHVLTVDLQRLLDHELTRASVAALERHLPVIARQARCGLEEVSARYDRLRAGVADGRDLGRATEGVVEYRAPMDARKTGLPAGSIDIIITNSVLEHVPANVMTELFEESHRLLSSDGLMVHGVNCGDHYAYVDKSITQLNYLQYSDAAWRFWDNAFLYQNRLRAPEFVKAVTAAGFDVVLNTAKPSERRLRELAALRVDARFSRFSAEELCVTSIDFVARRRASAPHT
jgi:SAM-dependent methyltransferase